MTSNKSSHFPEILKIVRFITICKGNNKNLASNYKTISILPLIIVNFPPVYLNSILWWSNRRLGWYQLSHNPRLQPQPSLLNCKLDFDLNCAVQDSFYHLLFLYHLKNRRLMRCVHYQLWLSCPFKPSFRDF